MLYDELLVERITCLKLIWTRPSNAMIEQPTWAILNDYVTRTADGLPDSVLSQLQTLSDWVEELLPGDKHSRAMDSLPEDVRRYHLQAIRRAQRDLASVMYNAAMQGLLSKHDCLRLVVWLKNRSEMDALTVMMVA